MKKTAIALSLALALTGGAALAGKLTMVTAKTPNSLNAWTSQNSKDKNSVTAMGVDVTTTVIIQTNRLVDIRSAGGDKFVPADGINVTCAGSTGHVYAGDAVRCVLSSGQSVTWSADDSQSPNYGAAGTDQIGGDSVK